MNFNTIPIFLIGILFLQSCSAYYGTSVSLSEAHNQGQAKVTSTRGVSYVFLNIELRDGVYYGLSEKYNSNIRLDSALITSINLLDIRKSKTQTTVFNISIFTGILVLIIYGLYTMTFSVSL